MVPFRVMEMRRFSSFIFKFSLEPFQNRFAIQLYLSMATPSKLLPSLNRLTLCLKVVRFFLLKGRALHSIQRVVHHILFKCHALHSFRSPRGHAQESAHRQDGQVRR